MQNLKHLFQTKHNGGNISAFLEKLTRNEQSEDFFVFIALVDNISSLYNIKICILDKNTDNMQQFRPSC